MKPRRNDNPRFAQCDAIVRIQRIFATKQKIADLRQVGLPVLQLHDRQAAALQVVEG
jgi:hypothetical protein